jgi:hypothetical protein
MMTAKLSQLAAHLHPGIGWTDGDTYESLRPLTPGVETPSIEALEAVRATVEAALNAPPVVQWPDAAAFLDTFTHAERGAIWNSEHPYVGSLTLKLVAWKNIVLANDPHIVAGMGLLVHLGILTQERHDEILGI